MSAVQVTDGALEFGPRTLWSGLNLDVAPGEFIAVLGPNGSGKTSFLKVLLGQQALSSGSANIAGRPVTMGNPKVGYIPQQQTQDWAFPLRAADLVGFGVDGHRFGIGLKNRSRRRQLVIGALEQVGASHLSNRPLARLSGGEQQRVRVAQAIVSNPDVMLCDEPLLSLDISNQQLVTSLIDQRRKEHNTAVLFVTHEINPVLPYVDRVLYLVDGTYRIGSVDEVMTSQTLSELYHSDVEVLRVRRRLIVIGTGDAVDALSRGGTHEHPEPEPR